LASGRVAVERRLRLDVGVALSELGVLVSFKHILISALTTLFMEGTMDGCPWWSRKAVLLLAALLLVMKMRIAFVHVRFPIIVESKDYYSSSHEWQVTAVRWTVVSLHHGFD